MPSYVVTVEDTAPFLTYAGSWRAGSSAEDISADKYSESSFTLTETQGSSISFTYYGTEAAVYGSKRGNHGNYQVTVDGASTPAASGVSTTDVFNATLFSGAVPKGIHTVTLTNSENKFLDVDTVSWMGSVGGDREQLIVNTRQDSHPDFQYTPSDAWTTSPYSVGAYSAASGHGTSTKGASMAFTFKGDAIALYGPAGPLGPSYSVQVAARPATTYSAQKTQFRARQLLYYAGGLGSGSHTLTMKLESQSSPQQMLAFDYAEIYTAPSLGGSWEGAPANLSTGLLAGLAIAAGLAFLGLLAVAILYIMYRKGRFHFGQVQPPSSNDKTIFDPGVPTTKGLTIRTAPYNNAFSMHGHNDSYDAIPSTTKHGHAQGYSMSSSFQYPPRAPTNVTVAEYPSAVPPPLPSGASTRYSPSEESGLATGAATAGSFRVVNGQTGSGASESSAGLEPRRNNSTKKGGLVVLRQSLDPAPPAYNPDHDS